MKPLPFALPRRVAREVRLYFSLLPLALHAGAASCESVYLWAFERQSLSYWRLVWRNDPGEGVRHNWLGRFLMWVYNRKGVFGNVDDTEEEIVGR